jgi:hypothetical protein
LLLPPTHNVTRGRQAIEQFFDELFKAGLTDHTLELIEVEGDQRGIAAAAGWTAKKREGAGEQTLSGIATHVFERRQGGLSFGYIRLTEQMCRRFRERRSGHNGSFLGLRERMVRAWASRSVMPRWPPLISRATPFIRIGIIPSRRERRLEAVILGRCLTVMLCGFPLAPGGGDQAAEPGIPST